VSVGYCGTVIVWPKALVIAYTIAQTPFRSTACLHLTVCMQISAPARHLAACHADGEWRAAGEQVGWLTIVTLVRSYLIERALGCRQGHPHIIVPYWM
jgi:hypothetical protein